MNNLAKYSLILSFEEVRFPPFEDIVIIGKKCPQGKIGLSKSFELLVPDEFEIFEVEDKIVEAVFINRKILKKINKERVINLLKEKVFPYVSESEILKVDLRIKVLFDSIEQEF
jgi:hypothetical protein